MSGFRRNRVLSSNIGSDTSQPTASGNSLIPSAVTPDSNGSARQPVRLNSHPAERYSLVQTNSGVVRHHINRNRTSATRAGEKQIESLNYHQNSITNDVTNITSTSINTSTDNSTSTSDTNRTTGNHKSRRGFQRHNPTKPNSANGNTFPKVYSQHHIKYEMLMTLVEKQPDEILAELLNANFQLKNVLADNRMKINFNWILIMTKLIEKITTCNGSRGRIVMILQQLPQTSYIDGVYTEVRKLDPITDKLRYDFIQSFLKISNTFLSMMPHSADDFTKILERIELSLIKEKTKSPECEETQAQLNEVLEVVKQIDRRQHQKSVQANNDTTTMNNNDVQHHYDPPPDDYRQLQIIPDVNEILSNKKPYIRQNIVNGIYDDPQHYLDIHFRLLREDFVGPLRDGIDQYLSKVEGKNFNVRIYENVRSLGPRLSPRSGIVYDLFLDPKMASKILWANSRRLIFGNLLLLTYNKFQSCAFVTVEDRKQIEKEFIISVKPLQKLKVDEQFQFDLDDINSSQILTMIETMTYFEAYRPVLEALQSVDINNTFPLAPFLLQLTNEKIAPDYVSRSTLYDFTPLLVDPNSEVKANIIRPNPPTRHNRFQRADPVNVGTELRLTYHGSNSFSTKYKTVPVLDTDQWPSSDALHLNPKQREALILALTHKVALIQGPPGTGKTYLGVRITEMLLHNRSVWCPSTEQSTPILMICHTNHALDQFLELVVKRLRMNGGIIRVGNRCQNPAIQPFSLMNARRSVRENRLIPSYIYHQKHAIFDKKTEAEEVLKMHEAKIEEARTKLISVSTLVQLDLIDNEHLASLLGRSQSMRDVDSVLYNWLCIAYEYEDMSENMINLTELDESMSNMTMNDNDEKEGTTLEEANGDPGNGQEQTNNTNNEEESDEKDKNTNKEESDEKDENEEEEEELRRRDEIDMDDEDFIEITASKSKSKKSIEKEQIKSKQDENSEYKWQMVKRKPYQRRQLIKNIIQNPTTLDDKTVQNIKDDLWDLPLHERFNLYRYWLLKYQQYLHDSVRQARRAYNEAITALAEYHQEEDYYILKDSVIVAMTTTCAAKYHSILEKLQSKIVIVEEAAAIFEAHIITALSTKCEHLILIGDHIQLRPSPSVYRLATKYHIDVSLFERFINNKFPNVRLNIQHRMRPEISRLMKHFYDDLEDHASVKDRPSIRGINNNIYFINHSNIETTVADGSSKRNEFEAKYVIELAHYLIKQGYQPSQITVLVMYLGQRQYIAREAKKIKRLQGVHVMVTDNYQGEENEIIILSLVRSNLDKKIGFLKIHNRICVALSRARCGLFVIGNMTLLADVEVMWKNIVKPLVTSDEIGLGLHLSCRQHSQEPFIADKPESFLKRPEGGCNKLCDTRLKCGHQCQLMCHNYDIEHKEIVCRKKCSDTLSCGHKCTKQCHTTKPDQHDPCRILVDKIVPTCKHKISFQCAREPTNSDCKQQVQRRLPCDHVVNVPCCIASSPSELKRFSCPHPCNMMLACKHKCKGTCGTCGTGRLHIPCQYKCERPLICSHVCKEPCTANCPPCVRNCETRCIHSQCTKTCGELCVPCVEPCAYKCKHLQCTRLCSEPCNRGSCNEPCDKKLKCGHDCIGICGEPCPSQCRICNKHIVQEILFGTEDEPDARFVFLPDCKHIIEVSALDRHIETSFNNSNEDTALRFPECPRCKKNIRCCTRYMPITNRVHNLIQRVKQKILGNQSEKDLNERRQRLTQNYQKIESNFKEISLALNNNNLFSSLFDHHYLTLDMLILMENTLLFLKEIDNLLVDGRKKLDTDVFYDLVNSPLRRIVTYLFAHPNYRNLAEQQINDIEAELLRINRLIFIQALVKSIDKQISAGKLKSDDKEGIESMQYLVKKIGTFTQVDKQKFDNLAKKLEHLNNLPGLGITDRERVAIVAALNLSKGHWYVCPKGHPYIITECGGANQESQCPECGEKIGGQNHRLVSSNRHFGVMDDSQHAAWSDEANMNM